MNYELSTENYDKLNENFLYRKSPVLNTNFYVGRTPGHYHCRNWTYTVKKRSDGAAFMCDTYFNSWEDAIRVTDENILEFQFVFDFREVEQIHDSTTDEYCEEDLYHVATGSGGYTCGRLHWVKKGTRRSNQRMVEKKKHEIERLKRSLKWAEEELARLLEK